MKKRIILISSVICVLIAAAFAFYICTKDASDSGRESASANQDRIKHIEDTGAHIVEKVIFDLPEKDCFKLHDNSLYFARQIENEDNIIFSYEIRKYDLTEHTDSEVFNFSITSDKDTYGYLAGFFFTDDGKIVLYKMFRNMSFSYIEKCICELDGTEISTSTLNYENEPNYVAIPCGEDSKGNDYVILRDETKTDTIILKIDSEGKQLYRGVLECVYDIPFIDSSDNIVIKKNLDSGFEYGYYDIEKDSFLTDSFKELNQAKIKAPIAGEYEGKLLFTDMKIFYSYDVQNQSLNTAIDFFKNDIRGDCISYIAQESDSRFYCIYTPKKLDAETELIILE